MPANTRFVKGTSNPTRPSTRLVLGECLTCDGKGTPYVTNLFAGIFMCRDCRRGEGNHGYTLLFDDRATIELCYICATNNTTEGMTGRICTPCFHGLSSKQKSLIVDALKTTAIDAYNKNYSIPNARHQFKTRIRDLNLFDDDDYKPDDDDEKDPQPATQSVAHARNASPAKHEGKTTYATILDTSATASVPEANASVPTEVKAPAPAAEVKTPAPAAEVKTPASAVEVKTPASAVEVIAPAIEVNATGGIAPDVEVKARKRIPFDKVIAMLELVEKNSPLAIAKDEREAKLKDLNVQYLLVESNICTLTNNLDTVRTYSDEHKTILKDIVKYEHELRSIKAAIETNEKEMVSIAAEIKANEQAMQRV